ncbi:MAG: winged helix-turn-helix domain-containing protein [Bacteroidales bacterium]|jgi:hypothetical protein|nr:winged helix-turn-helix domain-containing protein [Bacteroidales bacterium]
MIRNDIGINAGIIWQLLNRKGALPVSSIKAHTRFSSENIFYALGWLLREDKIVFFEKDDIEYVKLKVIENFSEIYF